MRVRYSEDYDPPAPVVSVRLGSPSGGSGVHVVALVDTGADMTVMPVAAVESLSLPVVAITGIAGVAGATQASVHAGLIDVLGSSILAEVVALGDEAIVGRDILNRSVLMLDGPRRVLEVRTPRSRAGRRRIRP